MPVKNIFLKITLVIICVATWTLAPINAEPIDSTSSLISKNYIELTEENSDENYLNTLRGMFDGVVPQNSHYKTNFISGHGIHIAFFSYQDESSDKIVYGFKNKGIVNACIKSKIFQTLFKDSSLELSAGQEIFRVVGISDSSLAMVESWEINLTRNCPLAVSAPFLVP